MKLGQMLEELQQLFPKVSRTQLILDLNEANADFCRRTRILWSQKVLTQAADLESSDAVYVYTLPADCYEIDHIDGVPKAYCMIEDGKLEVAKVYDATSDIMLWYVRRPGFDYNTNDTPEVPAEFHEALVSYVRQKYYRRNVETLPLAKVEQADYERLVRQGMAYRNTLAYRNVAAPVIVPVVPAAGGAATNVTSGTLAIAAGLSTITLDAGFVQEDTEFDLIVSGMGPEGPVVVSEYDPAGDRSTRTLTSFQVMAADACTLTYILVGNT